MAIVRKVTLKGDIIKGESITFDYPQEVKLISLALLVLKLHTLTHSQILILIFGMWVFGLPLSVVLLRMV